MKKKIFVSLAGLVCLFCVCAWLNSCSKLNAALQCQDKDYPYLCASAEKCCSYEWYDGHGYCYANYSDCRESGYSCTRCKK